MNQSLAKGVKKYSKAAVADTIGDKKDSGSPVQAYYIDTTLFKMDSLRGISEYARKPIDCTRYKLVYMDA